MACRAGLTTSHKNALEDLYQQNPRPSVSRQEEIANMLGLHKNSVSSWFSNRRRKDVLRAERSGDESLVEQLQGKKRSRLSKEQTHVLNMEWESHGGQIPSTNRLRELALAVGLSVGRLRKYLLNKRSNLELRSGIPVPKRRRGRPAKSGPMGDKQRQDDVHVQSMVPPPNELRKEEANASASQNAIVLDQLLQDRELDLLVHRMSKMQEQHRHFVSRSYHIISALHRDLGEPVPASCQDLFAVNCPEEEGEQFWCPDVGARMEAIMCIPFIPPVPTAGALLGRHLSAESISSVQSHPTGFHVPDALRVWHPVEDCQVHPSVVEPSGPQDQGAYVPPPALLAHGQRLLQSQSQPTHLQPDGLLPPLSHPGE